MVEYLKPYHVALEAWSPLAEGRHGLSTHPILAKIGERYGKTAAQVALRFLVQNGIVVIPKTTHSERMRENIALFDFELDASDMAAIRALDTGRRVTSWPPDALVYDPKEYIKNR
jgi:diketogulonate reductase-like aldo/keto reductase